MPNASEKNIELNKKINDFLDYLEVEKGSSPLTIRNYRHYLMRFANWHKAGLTDIDQKVVREFRLYLSRLINSQGLTLSRKTQGYHAIALRSLLKWLTRNDYEVMAPEKIELPKIDDRQVKFLTGEQVDRLLTAPSLSTINGKRDRAILEVLFSTGLRVSELVSLDRNKIDLKRREFGIKGKGGRTRVVFLSSRAADWIIKYTDSRDDHFNPLFISHRGTADPSTPDEKMRLSPRSVQRLVKKYSRKVNLTTEATPHTIRHSFATDLLIAGADLRSVQEMLGHKNVSTTQIYTHVTNRQLRGTHEKFHGKNEN